MIRARTIAILTVTTAAWLIPAAYAQQDVSQATAAVVQKTDVDADAALNRLYAKTPDARELVAEAKGVLVFPGVRAGGAVLGVEYGHGVLRSAGTPNNYYNVMTGSVGATLGYESKSVVLLFLTQEALDRFRNGNGWTAGVDGSVALLSLGESGKVDTNTAHSSIVGFVLTKKGLMVDLSLTGTRFTKAPV
ncbi:YSC84-related protein [Paraburkholderia sp. BCC1885]|uniref:BPSL1445 family SYLF domain-containing lipoprotein n=1 Tax=Paraburkholderia sp. BCC1885 TaxID=2562669 RepID=UPI001182483B|nr:YSC84-related protein [Paraburkholderia sp. BCC1885]